MKHITAIIQARVGSKRLRGKILKKIKGKEILSLLLSRLSKSKLIRDIIIAIPITKENDKLATFLKKKQLKVYRGSENDVLKRYYMCKKIFCTKYIKNYF